MTAKAQPRPAAGGAEEGSPRAAPPAGPSPAMSADQLREAYRAMVLCRTVDERMLTLQRQGRIGFYGTATGQEAACIGSAIAARAEDWIFPSLREGAALLLRGAPLVPYLAQLFGNSGDSARGRQMPAHQADRSVHVVSWSSSIGTQLPQAVGAAWAAKLRKQDTVGLAYLGEGATSTGDFHVAMNLAGVKRVPVVFVCQNNHWAISLPASEQTASRTFAQKAEAYGFPGVHVDGNDVEAVFAASATAFARARAGEGPTLIEAETYRIGPHSSADDPSRYRDPAELERWKARDPIARTRARLTALGCWSEEEERALRQQSLERVNAALAEAEKLPPPPVSTIFEDVYSALPWHLAEQRAELLGSRGPGGLPAAEQGGLKAG